MRTAAAVSLLIALLVADAAQAAPRAKLKAFPSCKALVGYARDGALRARGGAGVLGRAAPMPIDDVVTLPPPPVAREGVPVAAPVAGAVPEFSGTNVQEIGVDEPDIVKTDGRRIFAVTDRTLRVIAPGGGVTATLALEGRGHRLLLRGDRLLVIADKNGPVGIGRPVAPDTMLAASETIVTELDVSGAPKVLRTMEVPGRFVDARQNGGTARLVFDAAPDPIVAPAGGTVGRAVRRAGLRRFLGHTVLRSRLSGNTYRRKLAPCDAIAHPRRFSGLDVVAILTVDLDRGMYSLDRDGVMASPQVVYGSSDSLYVASRRYVRALELGANLPDSVTTEIHRFDISDPSRTVYRATGTVPGFVLNSYALSEYRGRLRVATTESPLWWPGGSTDSRSTVTVLDQQGARLVRTGSVTDLGIGERIYAVRFIGDRGYVVTFRQVDPLYTLDLSDPDRPRVAGELKIPGYSAYLHPVGDERLLGIGREGSEVQASLFDVSDPAAPRRLAQVALGRGSTPVEFEPHAFLYWEPAKLAVLPLNTYDTPPFTGAAGLSVGPAALTPTGRVAHAGGAPIERAFVIGDRLYTLSYLGLASSPLGDLASARFTAF
ncbi:MAG TPA: beta-propeller domain-containing protein [Solirubrobacter sp.]|nr:beta-propeller domain-containing protein [Solirubrobacter sp.]